jgi:hypothetical protein
MKYLILSTLLLTGCWGGDEKRAIQEMQKDIKLLQAQLQLSAPEGLIFQTQCVYLADFLGAPRHWVSVNEDGGFICSVDDGRRYYYYGQHEMDTILRAAGKAVCK